jgi:predicted HicB family RNase H-like nuclease
MGLKGKKLMRLTEYIDWLTRTDIGMASNPKIDDYTHLKVTMLNKRARYLYQCKIRGKEPVK